MKEDVINRMRTLGELLALWRERAKHDDPSWPSAMTITLNHLRRELEQALVGCAMRVQLGAEMELSRRGGGFATAKDWHAALLDELAVPREAKAISLTLDEEG